MKSVRTSALGLTFVLLPGIFTAPHLLGEFFGVMVMIVASAVMHLNPATGGMRLDFTVSAPDAEFYEMRAELWREGQRVSEAWLYRWVRK